MDLNSKTLRETMAKLDEEAIETIVVPSSLSEEIMMEVIQEFKTELQKAKDHLEMAWVVISNAGTTIGDWSSLPIQWRQTAEKWREDWHQIIKHDVENELVPICEMRMKNREMPDRMLPPSIRGTSQLNSEAGQSEVAQPKHKKSFDHRDFFRQVSSGKIRLSNQDDANAFASWKVGGQDFTIYGIHDDTSLSPLDYT